MPPPSVRQIQNRLTQLRLLGYAGVQFNALLAPLLVFQLTGSASLAGIALFIEWVPKLALYLGGGALLQRFGSSQMHGFLEAGRLGALSGLVLCAAGFGSVWVVALAAAVYQCSNALSNVLFERAVTIWWAPDDRPAGHAAFMQQDQWGCLLALLIGLALHRPLVLAGVAWLLQAVNFACVLRIRGSLYSRTEREKGTSFWGQLRTDFVAVAHPEIARFVVMALLLGIPSAFVFSSLAFILDRALVGAASGTGWLSFLLLARTGFGLVTLHGVKAQLAKSQNELELAIVGVAIMVVSTALLSLRIPLLAVIAGTAVLAASACLYLPWLRTERQELITNLIPESSRPGATGILIAVEAGSYLVGALILSVLGSRLDFATLLAGGLAALGATLAVERMRKKLAARGPIVSAL